MADPVLFAPGISGLPLSGTDYNQNWTLVESSFLSVASGIVTGLTVTAGSGLAVTVAAGTAIIGAEMIVPQIGIGPLTPSTLNYLYLQQNGQGTTNTSGTPPPLSIVLGTATTGVSSVTSVNMGRTSGRQQIVAPQNLIPGGPAAGTTSAGHLDGINLANWNATDAEGKSCFGVLPSGAIAVVAPLTLTVTDAGTTNEPNILLLQHRTSGAPAAAFGTTTLFQADNGANAVTTQMAIATGWSSPTAGAENSLNIFSVIRSGVLTEVMRLNAVGNGRLQAAQDFFHAGTQAGFFGITPIAQPGNTTDLRTAIINLGFLASGGATPLNLNGGTLTPGPVNVNSSVGTAEDVMVSRGAGLSPAWETRPRGGALTLCAGFTPAATGADTAEIVVPYDPKDGTTSIAWNVRRIDFRVQTAGGAPAITVEKSTGTGVFSATSVGTVTLGSGAFEGNNTTSLGTVNSGDKLRFNVGTLATATNWTIEVTIGQ